MAQDDNRGGRRGRFDSFIHILKDLWWLWLLIIVVGIVLKLFYLIIAGAAFLIVCGIIVLILKLAFRSDDDSRNRDDGS